MEISRHIEHPPTRYLRIVSTLLAGLLVAHSVFADEDDNLAPPAVTVATVTTALAMTTTMREHVSAYGTIVFAADHLHALSLPYQARVVGVPVVAGQTLHRGDPIIVLEPTASAGLELQRARNDAQFAQNELQRQRTLFSQHLATNAEVASATQAAHNAGAALAAAQARFGTHTQRTLRATDDAVVVDIAARADEVVAADTPFAHVGDKAGLQLRLGVEPAAAARIKVGQELSFSVVLNGATTQHAIVTRVSGQIDPGSRMVEVYAAPEKRTGLPPGAAVSANIVTATHNNVVGVPRSAVLYDHGNAYVFAVTNAKAIRRNVQTGLDDGKRIEIRSGLQANTPVVTLGNYELRDGMAVKVQ